jgi:predicted transcriptional regulator
MAMQARQYINEGYSNDTLIQFFGSARRSIGKYKIDQDDTPSGDIVLEILNTLEKSIIKQ